MHCKLLLPALLALAITTPAQAADDPVKGAEALLTRWRALPDGPGCPAFRALAANGISVDIAPVGAEKPEFKILHSDRTFKSACQDHLLPLVKDGIFKANMFCKKIPEGARCTLMSATSIPLALTFTPGDPMRPVQLQRIEWQRSTGKALPPDDDDDDLPM